jgi:hypothetical protein
MYSDKEALSRATSFVRYCMLFSTLIVRFESSVCRMNSNLSENNIRVSNAVTAALVG